jgi:formate dehydrogenase iron-sulfur subunit
VDRPEVYGLPPDPKMPSRNLQGSALWSALGAVAIGIMGLISFRNRGAGDA